MRNIPIVILLIILPSVCLAEFPPSIDFYTNGAIQDGNTFLNVRVFDNATVDMIGGNIKGGISLYNNSIFNAYDGAMADASQGWASTIVLFDSSVINLYKLDGGISYGFPLTGIEAWGANNQINFYGYGFQFTGGMLSGYWEDGSQFSFMIRSNDATRGALVFHEIPEPATLFLLGIGGFLIRKRH
jgi:hypothetical protein